MLVFLHHLVDHTRIFGILHQLYGISEAGKQNKAAYNRQDTEYEPGDRYPGKWFALFRDDCKHDGGSAK